MSSLDFYCIHDMCLVLYGHYCTTSFCRTCYLYKRKIIMKRLLSILVIILAVSFVHAKGGGFSGGGCRSGGFSSGSRSSSTVSTSSKPSISSSISTRSTSTSPLSKPSSSSFSSSRSSYSPYHSGFIHDEPLFGYHPMYGWYSPFHPLYYSPFHPYPFWYYNTYNQQTTFGQNPQVTGTSTVTTAQVSVMLENIVQKQHEENNLHRKETIFKWCAAISLILIAGCLLYFMVKN